ncbi:MAG: DegT/DnrJ/EryC1/StrS family aminotransferase [Planctomycetota bacterium]
MPTVTLPHDDAERWPVLTDEDESAVLEILRDGDLTTHPVTQALEADYRNYFGTTHALAHCNGTTALMAAFFALDLQSGDEVIVPSATWWSSALPMLWLGALPIFTDCESDRLGLCPSDVEAKITPRTKAIVVVHLWGMPARMTELLDIAKRHGLAVIEDASHAHGARWNDRPVGTLGDIGVFSLHGHKLAPAGEGGMLLTDNNAFFERATLLGDVNRVYQLDSPAKRFAATGFGIKTRMAPLCAAVGRVQLKHLDTRNAERNANIMYLAQRLEPLGIHTFQSPSHVERVYFEFLTLNNTSIQTQTLIERLQEEGCHVRTGRYPLLHQQPFFTEGHWAHIARLPQSITPPDYTQIRLPKIEGLIDKGLALPSFHRCEKGLLDQYATAFEKVIE